MNKFVHINAGVNCALAARQPVISVDTKKKELVGDFRNGGREWRPRGDPEDVRVHDFLIKTLGRAVPYGIYDLAAMPAGSASASTTTQRNSPFRRSAVGGAQSAASVIAMHIS